MPLTEAQQKELIVLAVGDDTAGTLAATVDLLWLSHDDTADMGLRALLTKLDAIDLMLGRVRSSVDFRTSSGSAVSADQLTKHLREMRVETEAAITQAQAGLGGGLAIGTLTKTAPVTPASGQPDPNARAHRGDPLKRWE